MLREELPGYRDHARLVPWRLVPRVWWPARPSSSARATRG